MTNETALAIQDADYTNGDLMPLGTLMNQEQIITLGDNLMGVHPAAKDIGKVGMRTVAQLAIMTGANPLPGTNGIHPWIDNKGKLCIQFGIGFWRGEVEKRGGMIWVDRPRLMTDDERTNWGVSENEVGFICRGTTWDAVKKIRQEEMELGGELSLKEAREMLYKEGVGIVGMETWGNSSNYKEQKTGRSLYWTAAERAERDLCRKLAPIFTPGQHVETRRLSRGPGFGIGPFEGEDENDLLFGPEVKTTKPEPEDGIFEEVPGAESEPEPKKQRAEVTEPERHTIADIRAELEGEIKDGIILLGDVYETAVKTGLYNNWQHAYRAVTNKKTGFDLKGAKSHKKSKVTGKGGLAVFDWLVSRKVNTSDEEE